MGHARSLLMLDETQQREIAKIVIAKNLSVRETELLVSRAKSGREPNTPVMKPHPAVSQQLDILAQRLQTKVKVKANNNGTGQLIISYEDQKSLDQLIEQLGTCLEI